MASDIKNKKWLGYAAYFVLITAVLLYFLFPADSVEELLNNSVNRINPEFNFKAEKIRPWIPAGLMINSGKIYQNNTSGSAIFNADRVYVTPSILKLLKGEYSAGIEGRAYKGDINGTIHFTKGNRDVASEIIFRDFVLEEYDFLAEKFKTRVLGKLSGEVVYNHEYKEITGGSGSIDLRLRDGLLRFQNPVFNITGVDLQSINLEAKLNRREISIIKAELQGPEVKGSMTGSIKLHEDMRMSQLNLRGTLEPLAQFYQKHPEIRELMKTMNKRVKRGQYFFTLTGTLGDPRFNLL